MDNFDVVIIGAGPGGYVAAIRASQLGKKVAIIEKEHLGGVCLNWGCIPTKALLRSAEVKHLLDHVQNFGLEIDGTIKVNLPAMVQRSRKVASQLAAGIKGLLQKNKVTVFDGAAVIKNPKTVTVGDKALQTNNIIIATGARGKNLPNLAAHPLIWQARQAMTPSFLPEKLLIVGSGAIGIEFASFYQTLGSQVTVAEIQPRILLQEDEEIAAFAQKSMQKQGVKFLLSSKIESITPSEKSVNVVISNSQNQSENLTFEAVIMAIGITGNVENLGLENTKIEVKNGQIQVDEWGETTEKGVFAIGDVAGAPWLAHKASHEGVIVAEKIANYPDVHPLNKGLIPACTYGMPQIASIGLTENQAKEKGLVVKIGRFPYKGNGKAIALGEAEGLIKTIFDNKTGELLGAHMVGAEVTELIQGFVIAKNLETTEQELMQTIFPHPSLSEMMHESVLDAYGKVIHF